jgi:transporter family protein
VTLAVIFLKEKLNWQVVAGAALMAGGAVVIALSEPSK